MVLKIYLNLIFIIKFLKHKSTRTKLEHPNSISCIIFSKDRPIQLYATLESYFKNTDEPIEIKVIYCASNDFYKDGYTKLIELFYEYNVQFILENNFRLDLINILNHLNSRFIFFLVDDIIFKSKFSFKSFLELKGNHNYILSLRLGSFLNYCYPKSEIQLLPIFQHVDNGFLTWDFWKSTHDWAYAFSVDGHLYNLNMVKLMAQVVEFNGPNSFESSINVFKYIFYLKKGLCFPDSKLVNVSLNRVQNEIENITGGFSAEELNNKWSDNYKIDISKFINIKNKSAHIEVDDILFVKR